MKSLVLDKEMSAIQHAETSKSIKGRFIASEKHHSTLYIRDLEKNLALNKEIIAELVKANAPGEKTREVIERLNAENKGLVDQVRRLVVERDEAVNRLLIAEQMIESMKRHEEEARKELLDHQKEILDQLDRKEYMLQKFERRYEKALTVLKKLKHKDQEVGRVLKEFKADRRVDCKVSNLVEENERLQTELVNEKAKVTKLTAQASAEEQGKLGIVKAKEAKSLEIQIIENLQLEKVKMNLAAFMVSSFEDLPVAKNYKKEFEKFNKRVKELYKINLGLSEALRSANDKLLSLTRKGGSRARSRNRVAFTLSNGANAAAGNQISTFEAARDPQPNDLLSPVSKSSSILSFL